MTTVIQPDSLSTIIADISRRLDALERTDRAYLTPAMQIVGNINSDYGAGTTVANGLTQTCPGSTATFTLARTGNCIAIGQLRGVDLYTTVAKGTRARLRLGQSPFTAGPDTRHDANAGAAQMSYVVLPSLAAGSWDVHWELDVGRNQNNPPPTPDDTFVVFQVTTTVLLLGS